MHSLSQCQFLQFFMFPVLAIMVFDHKGTVVAGLAALRGAS